MTDFQPRSLDELTLEWPPELDHVSASSIKMASRCKEQWRQRYVLGKKQVPAAAVIMGRADHAAIEHSMRQKIYSYTDSPVGEVKDKFAQVVEEEIEKDGGYKELEVRDGKEMVKGIRAKKQVVGAQIKFGQSLAGMYHHQISPKLQPTAVEQPIEIHTRLPVKITGYIDLIVDPVGAEAGDLTHMIDRKRVSRYGVQAEWRLAADVYQIAYPIPHAWHLSNTSGGGRIMVPDRAESELIQPPPNPERAILFLEQIMAEIGFLYRKYGPDHPWPTNGKLHPFACNYCGYRPSCWGWE